MCFYVWFINKTNSIDETKTKTNEESDPLRFLEKLELWLFLKSRVAEKNDLPPLDDFVINPMRESTEVIIGGDCIIFS